MQRNTNKRAVTTFIFRKADNQIFKSPILNLLKAKTSVFIIQFATLSKLETY